MIHVNGEMDKHLPLNTIGRAIDISTFTRSKPGSFSGMKAPGSPYVNLNGVWGLGKIEASGRLRHEPDVHGYPVGPEATPITVTLQQATYWWTPVCPKH